MLFRLILLFTVTPVVELLLLLELSKITSIWSTIGLVLVTGVVGAYLAKSQGRLIITKIRMEMNEGRMPGDQLLNGLCVLVGGALLLTPGIITDVVGFTLVIPGTREIFKGIVKKIISKRLQDGSIDIHYRRW
ncbi:FxsA family protein [Wukongibacter baidiensis]|uniref:FxsA family protein n=1 Tax=Wukongibacter baidiensis TaxID=1723361 RepID=UPI003D7F42AB